MTIDEELTCFTVFSKEVPLKFTVLYSSNQKKIHQYQIECGKEKIDSEDVNSVGKIYKESEMTITYFSNILNQFIGSKKNLSFVQILEDSDTKIAIIDFSQIEDIKDDEEIDLMFVKHKSQIAEADII